MHRMFDPRPLFLAFAVAVVVAAAVRASRPAPAPPESALLSAPTLNDAYFTRWENKGRIAADAVAARISLLEAAAAFRELDASWLPYSVEEIREGDPSVSMNEAYCRIVIRWVQTTAPSEQAEYMACSLQKELDVRLREGTLHLPKKAS